MFNLDSALGIHPQAALLRARRAEIISGNLANADTPGYQARDIDFNAALNQAMGGEGGDLQMAATREGHLSLGGSGVEDVPVQYRNPTQPSLDQNTVDVQGERSRFLDNSLRYQASVQFIDSTVSGLLKAIRGD